MARQAAEVASNDGIVIGNNPSFFFYLTYFMPAASPATNRNLAGILPSSVRAPNIHSPQEWMETGAPTKPVCCGFRWTELPGPGAFMEEIRAALSARCKTVGEQDPVRDAGAKWKQE